MKIALALYKSWRQGTWSAQMDVETRQEVHLHLVQVKGTAPDPYREPPAPCPDCSNILIALGLSIDHSWVTGFVLLGITHRVLKTSVTMWHSRRQNGETNLKNSTWGTLIQWLLYQNVSLVCGFSFFFLPSTFHPRFLFILIPFGLLHVHGLLRSWATANPTCIPNSYL